MYTVPFLLNNSFFSNIDIQFAGFMAALARSHDPAVPLAAALTSRNVRHGNVCIDLAAQAGQEIEPGPGQADRVRCPELATWRPSLLQSGVVGEPGEYTPLILDRLNRLYLFRYWEYEKKLADALLEKAAQPLSPYDRAAARNSLDRLFPGKNTQETSWPKVAAAMALLKRLCVVSGGPGTGKTFAVARILAFLLERQKDAGGALRIFLAAPTGKAASRLTESITRAREALPCAAAVKQAIPSTGLTIHRLLESRGQATRFFFNAGNRLPADVVVVDEASMVDLPLMSKLVQALPPDTRLILLGDADQLASVEAGSVLGDICGENRTNRFSVDFINHIKPLVHVAVTDDSGEAIHTPGLEDCRIHFTRSYRFNEKSRIPQLSRVVNQGRPDAVVKLLSAAGPPDVSWMRLKPDSPLQAMLREKIALHYGGLARERDPSKALASLNRFKILCAINKGPRGVKGVNQMVVEILAEMPGTRGFMDRYSPWYHGRPILIRKNDYQVDLFNGDMGVVLRDPENQDTFFAFFHHHHGKIRRIAPFRLPEHETAYAMTIHKSQGSEFDDVMMVLPDQDAPLLTRELIYTGITRARQNLSILASESVIRQAVSRRVIRASGLRQKLAD